MWGGVGGWGLAALVLFVDRLARDHRDDPAVGGVGPSGSSGHTPGPVDWLRGRDPGAGVVPPLHSPNKHAEGPHGGLRSPPDIAAVPPVGVAPPAQTAHVPAPSAVPDRTLLVAVTTCNQWHLTDAVLANLASLTDPIEVVVVDDHSEDGTAALARARGVRVVEVGPDIRIHAHTSTHAPAYATHPTPPSSCVWGGAGPPPPPPAHAHTPRRPHPRTHILSDALIHTHPVTPPTPTWKVDAV
jgi:hypothetical protein